MTRRIVTILAVAALASACGKSQSAQRKDQNYQVVQEGQASGVTSTINAPGENPAPMTNTGVDTTTNLTLLDNPAPMGSQTTAPNTVAGSLPAGAPATNGAAPSAPPRGAPTTTMPAMTSASSAPTTTDTVSSSQSAQQQSQPRRRPRPTQTETTSTQAPPPATDTTTSTQAPPPPPPPTDTSSTTKTDTTKTGTQQNTDTGQKTDTTKTDTQPPPV